MLDTLPLFLQMYSPVFSTLLWALEVDMFKLYQWAPSPCGFWLGSVNGRPWQELRRQKGSKIRRFIYLLQLLGYCGLLASCPWKPWILSSILFIQLIWVPVTSPSPLWFRHRSDNTFPENSIPLDPPWILHHLLPHHFPVGIESCL